MESKLTERELQSLLLNAVPADGATIAELAERLQLAEAVAEGGLRQLVALGLIVPREGRYHPSAFAQKAMKMFKIA